VRGQPASAPTVELDEQHPLPPTQRQTTLIEGHGQGGIADQTGPNVAEAVRSKLLLEVVPSPGQVVVGPVAILRSEALQDARQVLVEPSLVLVDQQRAGRVLAEELQEPRCQAAAGHQLIALVDEVDDLGPLPRLDVDAAGRDHHGCGATPRSGSRTRPAP
jgi:hypothetical protein